MYESEKSQMSSNFHVFDINGGKLELNEEGSLSLNVQPQTFTKPAKITCECINHCVKSMCQNELSSCRFIPVSLFAMHFFISSFLRKKTRGISYFRDDFDWI